MNDENVPDNVRCGKHRGYFLSSVLGYIGKNIEESITILTQQCNLLVVDPHIRGKNLETWSSPLVQILRSTATQSISSSFHQVACLAPQNT